MGRGSSIDGPTSDHPSRVDEAVFATYIDLKIYLMRMECTLLCLQLVATDAIEDEALLLGASDTRPSCTNPKQTLHIWHLETRRRA